MRAKHVDLEGREMVDSKPMELPLDFSRPPTIQEMIKQLVKKELSEVAQGLGAESFLEADDFSVDDDFDPKSPWELNYDQETATVGGSSIGSGDPVVAGEVERPGQILEEEVPVVPEPAPAPAKQKANPVSVAKADKAGSSAQ